MPSPGKRKRNSQWSPARPQSARNPILPPLTSQKSEPILPPVRGPLFQQNKISKKARLTTPSPSKPTSKYTTPVTSPSKLVSKPELKKALYEQVETGILCDEIKDLRKRLEIASQSRQNTTAERDQLDQAAKDLATQCVSQAEEIVDLKSGLEELRKWKKRQEEFPNVEELMAKLEKVEGEKEKLEGNQTSDKSLIDSLHEGNKQSAIDIKELKEENMKLEEQNKQKDKLMGELRKISQTQGELNAGLRTELRRLQVEGMSKEVHMERLRMMIGHGAGGLSSLKEDAGGVMKWF